MAMTQKLKDNKPYILGGIGTSLIIFFFTQWREASKEQAEKLNTVYEFAITQSLRDSLQNTNIGVAFGDIKRTEIKTDMNTATIEDIQKSLIEARVQLNTINLLDAKIQQR